MRATHPGHSPGFTLLEAGRAPRTLLDGYTVKAASAAQHNGVLYLLGVVEDADGDAIDDLVFAHGPENGVAFTTTVAPFFARCMRQRSDGWHSTGNRDAS